MWLIVNHTPFRFVDEYYTRLWCWTLIKHSTKVSCFIACSTPQTRVVFVYKPESCVVSSYSLLIGVSKHNLLRLQRIQNRAARICLSVSRKSRIPSVQLLQQLHWLPIASRIEFKILLLTYKCLHNLASPYLSQMLSFHDVGRSLRSTSQQLLSIPHCRTKRYGDRAFSCIAPRLWNGLPLLLRSRASLVLFKKDLKTFLFRKAFTC